MGFAYNTWGASWGTSWLGSWGSATSPAPTPSPTRDQGAGSGRQKRKLTSRDITVLLEEYRRVSESKLPAKEAEELKEAVTPYTNPNMENAIALNALPDFTNVNFKRLARNAADLGKLESILEEIRLLQEDEDLALIAMLASYV